MLRYISIKIDFTIRKIIDKLSKFMIILTSIVVMSVFTNKIGSAFATLLIKNKAFNVIYLLKEDNDIKNIFKNIGQIKLIKNINNYQINHFDIIIFNDPKQLDQLSINQYLSDPSIINNQYLILSDDRKYINTKINNKNIYIGYRKYSNIDHRNRTIRKIVEIVNKINANN